MQKQFSDLLRSAARTISSNKAKEANDWLNTSVKEAVSKKSTDPYKVFKKTGLPKIGQMCLFVYDAKTKATLPFFDMHPLVFPIQFYDDGFLGLNLHYLPPAGRAQLMDALYNIATNDKYSESNKLNISYDLLRKYSNQFSGFENCLKRYLYGYVRSSFNIVNSEDWDKVVMLPLQRWSVNPNKKYASSPPY